MLPRPALFSWAVVAAAHCESLPRMRHFHAAAAGDDKAGRQWTRDLAATETCREELAGKGVPGPFRQWPARFVATRRSDIIPAANALGYFRDQRKVRLDVFWHVVLVTLVSHIFPVLQEDDINPNRNFPFDILPADSNKCMQTVAGRSINKLFCSQIFPVGSTFYRGMEVIGYELGAPTYYRKVTAQRRICEHVRH